MKKNSGRRLNNVEKTLKVLDTLTRDFAKEIKEHESWLRGHDAWRRKHDRWFRNFEHRIRLHYHLIDGLRRQ